MRTTDRLQRAISFSSWIRDSMMHLMDPFEREISGRANDELVEVLRVLRRRERIDSRRRETERSGKA